MAARVVYEGLESGGGDLFRGQRFFLLQRIPQRNHWKDLVTANGGEVVKLESQATVVIADHVLKNQPVGSISWKWIEDSVKNGILADVEEHRAGPTEQVTRPVGSSQPARKGRTPFTTEDDRVLMKWCAKAERDGLSLKGNEIYQQLEKINNRHTYQSWRDRWIKFVSSQPRPEELEEEHDDNDEEAGVREVEEPEPGPIRRPVVRPVPKSTPPPVKLPSRRAPKESAQNSPLPTMENSSPIFRSPKPNLFIQKSAGGDIFSEEETQELINVFDDILEIQDDKIIDAWMAYSAANPNHTAQEWRNHFTEYVVPKVTADRQRKETKPSVKAKQTVQTISGPSSSNPGQRQTNTVKANKTVQVIPGPSSSRSGGRQIIEVESNRNVEAISGQGAAEVGSHHILEVKDSQGSSGETFQSPKQNTPANEPPKIDEATFKKDVTYLADGFNIEVNFNPIISGRKLPLIRLWELVESQEFGGYDRVDGTKSWHKVAKRLNFNEFKHPHAAAELKDCFGEILADYEYAVNRSEDVDNFEEVVSLTASQEEALLNEQLHGTAAPETNILEQAEPLEEDEEDDDLEGPQSTPKQPSFSTKRSFDSALPKPLPHKRQRIDKGKGKEPEIPSTPEDVINGKQFYRPTIQSSPLKYPELNNHEDDEDFDVIYHRSTKFTQAVQSTVHSSIPSRVLEPETQDFHFLPEQQNYTNPADDLTPSPPRSSPKLPSQTKSSQTKSSQPKSSTGATHGTPHSSNKKEDSSTQSQTESEKDAARQVYIDTQIAMGSPLDVILEALASTCNEETNAGYVIEQLMIGEGIPENVRGVWTYHDDQAASKGRHDPDWDRVVKKHGGLKQIFKRRTFLKEERRKVKLQSASGSKTK